MFWGLKLEEGMDYSQLVKSSFHISQATIDFSPDSRPSLLAVHAEIHETDYILCYLGRPSDSAVPIIQQSLNLDIDSGEELTLYVEYVDSEQEIANGKVESVCQDSDPSKKGCVKSVHLTGYFTGEAGEDLETVVVSECEDEDEGTEDEVKVDEVQMELNGDSVPSIETLSDEDELPVTKKRKRKRKDSTKDVPTDTEHASTKIKTKKKLNVKHENDAPKANVNGAVKKPKSAQKAKSVPVVKTSGGTEMQDLVQGMGKIAKPGRKVFVKYTGRLAHNNQIFDSNITGKRAFMFQLGKGEVVKGWDEGVTGMRVGGKRKLAIPPNQGYGSKGAPPAIPPNSKLIFDIELTAVK